MNTKHILEKTEQFCLKIPFSNLIFYHFFCSHKEGNLRTDIRNRCRQDWKKVCLVLTREQNRQNAFQQIDRLPKKKSMRVPHQSRVVNLDKIVRKETRFAMKKKTGFVEKQNPQTYLNKVNWI